MTEENKAARSVDREGFNKFINEFKEESDRAAVILGAAKLDLLLYQILQQYLAPITGSKDELLDGDSPLGTFSSKIMLINRLGLIDNDLARLLHLIRKIRNNFAHEASGCTLNSGSHRDRVTELVGQLKHKIVFINARDEVFGGKDDPSSNFRTALAFLVVRLDVLLAHVEAVDCSGALSFFNEAMLTLGEVENTLQKAKKKESTKSNIKKLTSRPS